MRSRVGRSVSPLVYLSLFFAILSLLLLTACGSDTKPTPPPVTPPAVTVAVSPATTSVQYGSTMTFTAVVANATNTAVTWSVDEGANGGTITSAGVYTPPNAEGTFHVTATSQADTSKKATSPITVTIPTTVAVTPGTAELAINGQQAFTAAVTHVTDSSVMWSVREVGGGVIDSTGNYIAPNKAGTYHIVATSVEHTMKSGSAAVTVIAPPPTITTTAPLAAAEAELYSYTPAATDPAEGTIDFVLVSGPTGAKIEEGVLTWTPEKEQSRVESSFTIRAVTSEGASVEQSWNITPTGIIRGVMIAKHLHAAGVTDVPVDLTNFGIYAHVPDGEGGLIHLQGSGTTEGTFEIPGVPAGKYWLDVSGLFMDAMSPVPPVESCGWSQILTNRSDIDLSCYVQGRPDVNYATEGTVRHFQILGITPWKENDYLELAIPNAGEWNGWGGLQLDSISYDGLQNAYRLATDDAGSLGQWTSGMSNGGRPYNLLTKVVNFPSVTDVDGGEVVLTGTMQDVAGTHPFDASIAGSQFKTLNTKINPDAQTEYSQLYIETHPFGLNHGFVDFGPALFYFNAWAGDSENEPVETDVDLGHFSYGNPYPSTWPLVAEYWHGAYVPYTDSSSQQYQLYASYYQFTDALPTLAQPVKPILGPVTGATVDEAAFFSGQEISATPTIAWGAPEVGTAQGYVVQVIELSSGSMWVNWEFRTTDTSITIPAGILQDGTTYVFAIKALNETGQDLAATPFMKGFPRAGAWTTSGIFTVAAPSMPGITAKSRSISGFKPMRKAITSLDSSRRQPQKKAR